MGKWPDGGGGSICCHRSSSVRGRQLALARRAPMKVEEGKCCSSWLLASVEWEGEGEKKKKPLTTSSQFLSPSTFDWTLRLLLLMCVLVMVHAGRVHNRMWALISDIRLMICRYDIVYRQLQSTSTPPQCSTMPVSIWARWLQGRVQLTRSSSSTKSTTGSAVLPQRNDNSIVFCWNAVQFCCHVRRNLPTHFFASIDSRSSSLWHTDKS